MNDFILVTWLGDEEKQIMKKSEVKGVTQKDGDTYIEWRHERGGISGKIKESMEAVFKMLGE